MEKKLLDKRIVKWSMHYQKAQDLAVLATGPAQFAQSTREEEMISQID